MKLRPMLGEFALDDIETIESSESRALVEHPVPGLEGSYFQDLGSVPNTIVLTGTKHGDERRDAFLEGIRELFNSGQPTTFVADINTATDLTEVVIEDLEVAEVGGSADTFRYRVKLRKYVEPPEPPAAGLLDGGILDDALSLTDALDVIDALGSIPDLGDPTEPLRGALDGVKGATSGLDQTVGSLRSLFGEPGAGPEPGAAAATGPSTADGAAASDPAAGPPGSAPAPGAGPAAMGGPAAGAPGTVPGPGAATGAGPLTADGAAAASSGTVPGADASSGVAPDAAAAEPPGPPVDDLHIAPDNERVDVGAKFALQRMLKRPDMEADARRLIGGINGGTLAAIYGDDLGVVALEVAPPHGVPRWELVPKGEDAALVLDAQLPLETPPTVVFRGDTPDIRGQPARIDPALQQASKTFDLWLSGRLGLCAASPSATPVANLVPASFCELHPGRLDVLVVDTKGAPVAGAGVQISGPVSKDGETGGDGAARFAEIPPGEYTITAERQGYAAGQTRVLVLPGTAPPVPIPGPPLPGTESSALVDDASGAAALDGGSPAAGSGGKAVVVLGTLSLRDRIKNVRILALHFLYDHKVMRRAPSKTVHEVITATKKIPHVTRLMDDGPMTDHFVKPDWTPSKSNPISKTKNTEISIRLEIEFELEPGPQMELQGLTSITQDKFMEFETRFDKPLILTGAKTVVKPGLISKNRLPDRVDILEGGKAEWVLHIDGQDFHPMKFKPALTTGPHKIFVTLGTPTGFMTPGLEAADAQVITDGRLEFSCGAAKGTKTARGAADAIFRHLRDVEKVRYRGGFKWSPGPTPNDTAVEPKPLFHDYLWLCNKNIAAGECHYIAAAFVLAVKALGVSEEMEVGVMYPWPRRVNTLTSPDQSGPNHPFWPPGGFPGHRFQGRYQKFAVLKDTERYVRLHQDEHPVIDPDKDPAPVEVIRFRDDQGLGNTFEGVARLGRTLYAIGEPDGILEANSANFPGFSSLSEKGKLHASATLFYAVKGNLERGRLVLYFIRKDKVSSDNTTKDPNQAKCQRPYIGFTDPHFRWED